MIVGDYVEDYEAIAPPPGWRFRLGVGFFVLGGDFWDKLRAIFSHKAKASFPA